MEFFQLPAYEFLAKNESLILKHSGFDYEKAKDKNASIVKTPSADNMKEQKPKKKKKKINSRKKQTTRQKLDQTSITSAGEDDLLKN